MPQNRKTIIADQTHFYRNNFRRLLNFLFVLIAIAYLLIGLVVYQHLTRPVSQYFVTTSDGRLVEIQPAPSP